ncbi:MAG: hypothetical protein J7621_25055 [Niastella sp.]|nr:hypothetical protein [Niastella sp.]
MKAETGIIIASLLLVLFLVWKEIKRPAKAHLFLRLAASVLAVAALACIVLPISYTTKQSTRQTNAAILLTPGYDKDSLTAYNELQRYTTYADLATGSNSFIPELSWFLSEHPSVNELHVFGFGLTDEELTIVQKKGIKVQYHEPAPPAGFTAAGWPRQLHQGDWLEVQGSFHNTGKEKTKVVLTGLGSRFDSVSIDRDTTQTFRLRCKPAHLGSTVYELEASRGDKATVTEKLPVQVLPTSHLQVLLLSSSPDFDNKFLTTWLYENQYGIAARNTISKNKYGQQFLNREAISLQNISTSLLEKFDVVIADDAALVELNGAERSALISQVQKGLGLILQTDSTVSVNSFAAGWQIRKQPGAVISARPLAMPAVFTTTSPLLPTQWLSIENNRRAQPLVMDDKGAIVVSSALAGAGKLVLSTVNNTYSWILSGNQADYAQFWSLLLNKAARRAPQETRWQQVTAFPTVGNAAELTLETAVTSRLPVLETPDGKVPVVQHAWQPHTWTGTWWPVQRGWQAVSQGQDSLRLYIYEQGEWASVQATARIMVNKQHAAVSGSGGPSKDLAEDQTRKQLPPVIFFVVFLSCCSYLWFEAKKA